MKNLTLHEARELVREMYVDCANAVNVGTFTVGGEEVSTAVNEAVTSMLARFGGKLSKIRDALDDNIPDIVGLKVGASGCPCEPSGSDGLRCPGADGKLLCDPEHKPEEAVAEVVDMKYNRVKFYRADYDTTVEYLQPGTKLYLHPAAPEKKKS